MDFSGIKVAVLQGVIVLVPTYSVAYMTDKMVWTIPMLAAAGFIASSIRVSHKDIRRLDEDSASFKDIEDG